MVRVRPPYLQIVLCFLLSRASLRLLLRKESDSPALSQKTHCHAGKLALAFVRHGRGGWGEEAKANVGVGSSEFSGTNGCENEPLPQKNLYISCSESWVIKYDPPVLGFLELDQSLSF